MLMGDDLTYNPTGLYSLGANGEDMSNFNFDETFNLNAQQQTISPQFPNPQQGNSVSSGEAVMPPGAAHNPYTNRVVNKNVQVGNGGFGYAQGTLPMPPPYGQSPYIGHQGPPMPPMPPMPAMHVMPPAGPMMQPTQAPAYQNDVWSPEQQEEQPEELTPNRAPGTPQVVEPWKWHRSANERRNLNLKETRIPRITRVKDGTGDARETFDATQFYGPPVKPPVAWGPKSPRTRNPKFSYTPYSELALGKKYTVAEMKQYLYGRCLKKTPATEFVPRTVPSTERHVSGKLRQGLTLWCGWPPSQTAYRYPRPGTSTCRFENCPHPTIRQGQPRVILDERMNDQGLEIDPFHNAMYVHLYCLEKNFEIIEIMQHLDFRMDERVFKKEEGNFFKLSGRDGKTELDLTYKRWWKRECNKYIKAHAQGGTRDRRNFIDTSLTSALLLTKMKHESSARGRTRELRNGIDITKYWGDLEMLVQLQQERDSARRASHASVASSSTPMPRPPSAFSDEEYRAPRTPPHYELEPPQAAQQQPQVQQQPQFQQPQQQPQQFGGNGMPAPSNGATQMLPMPPMPLMAPQGMNVLNTAYGTRMNSSAPTGWAQQGQQPLQQPMMMPPYQQQMPQKQMPQQQMPQQQMPQPYMPNQQYQNPALAMPMPQQGSPAGVGALQNWDAAQWNGQQIQGQAYNANIPAAAQGFAQPALDLGGELDFNDPAIMQSIEVAFLEPQQKDGQQGLQSPQQRSRQRTPQSQGNRSPAVQGEFRASEVIGEVTGGRLLSPSEKFAADGVNWTLEGVSSFPTQGSSGSGGAGFDKQISADEMAKLFGTPTPSPPRELSPSEKFAEQKVVDWNGTSTPPQQEKTPSEKFAEQKLVGWEQSWTPVNSPPYSPFASAQIRYPKGIFQTIIDLPSTGSSPNSLFASTPSAASRRSTPKSPLGGSQ